MHLQDLKETSPENTLTWEISGARRQPAFEQKAPQKNSSVDSVKASQLVKRFIR